MCASAAETVANGCACVPSAPASMPVGDTNTPYSSETTHASTSGLSVPSHIGGGAPPLPAAASAPPSPLLPAPLEKPPPLPLAPPNVPLIPELPLVVDAPDCDPGGQSRRAEQSVKLLHDESVAPAAASKAHASTMLARVIVWGLRLRIDVLSE